MAAIDAVIEHRSRYAVEVLSRYTPVAAAYLFGSWAEGSADEWSNIDLEEKINLQREGSEAKPYQVRQVRTVILKYQLGGQEP